MSHLVDIAVFAAMIWMMSELRAYWVLLVLAVEYAANGQFRFVPDVVSVGVMIFIAAIVAVFAWLWWTGEFRKRRDRELALVAKMSLADQHRYRHWRVFGTFILIAVVALHFVVEWRGDLGASG